MKDAWEISVGDILTSSGKYPLRPIKFPPTPDMMINAARLAKALSSISLSIHRDLSLSSGYRPPPDNERAGGAKNSWHLYCAAGDVSDPDGQLGRWALAEEKFLGHLGLWCEHPLDTPGWVHFQLFPPASQTRFFRVRQPSNAKVIPIR